MSNKFANRGFQGSSASTENLNNNVDWKKLNEHIAGAVQEATECEEGSPVPTVGILSGIVDYGMREYPEVEEILVSPKADDKKANEFRAKLVENGKGEVFQAEDGTDMIRYKPTNAREVGYFVDFPSITVDKGQFFGESNPAPYRVLIGGVFKGDPARPVKVTGYPKNGSWYCGDGSYHVKLAKAAGISVKDGFKQDDLLQLIGQPISFNLEVYINEQGFLQEKVNTPNKLMKGIAVPEYNEDLLFYVGFYDEENDEQSLKFLTKPVKEYIKKATNYEGSVIKTQLEALEGDNVSDSSNTSSEANTEDKTDKTSNASTETKALGNKANTSPEIDFDDDIPF